MITRMAKVRVIGPRAKLAGTLRWLQEFGLLHLADTAPAASGVDSVSLSGREHRRARQLSRIIADADAALGLLGPRSSSVTGTEPHVAQLARWATLAADTRARLERMAARDAALSEELALIGKYDEFLEAFDPLLKELAATPGLATHAIIVPASERKHVQQLVSAMESQGAQEWVAARRTLRSGDLAILVVIQAKAAEQFDELLTKSRLPELPVPSAFGGRTLAEALPLMRKRLEEIPQEREQLSAERSALGDERGDEIAAASAAAHDLLDRLRAMERCGVTSHAFAVDGWIPERDAGRLVQELTRSLGPDVGAAVLDTALWDVGEAPVALRNPRILRPFEAIVKMMPLPRYGSIDPTPFVAVFFPVMFGLIVGDVAYGLLIAAIGLVLHRASRPGSLKRTVAEIMGPCAGFTIIFGFLYGELLGDFGRRSLGLHHVLFDREESVVAMLFVAVGLGLVHVTVGLLLGVVSRWHSSPRHALGSGVMLLMVILLIVAVLATTPVLPDAVFTPTLVALLLAVPVLIAAEGIIAPIEFLATLGNILSYARVMALGTAGVMLAVVANQMVGAIGSTIVGILFALVFHAVNFAIALFSPTIHVLRLHYVEFFGKFYAPGGRAYQPFRQWKATPPAP